jgi:hypothetical protein
MCDEAEERLAQAKAAEKDADTTLEDAKAKKLQPC